MEVKLFNQLSTCSKRCAMSRRKRWGKNAPYYPRMALIERLARDNNLSKSEVPNILLKEIQFLKGLVQ
jgi:hypothetical protein